MQATRDFAVEAAQLSEALAQKEEEVQMTGQLFVAILVFMTGPSHGYTTTLLAGWLTVSVSVKHMSAHMKQSVHAWLFCLKPASMHTAACRHRGATLLQSLTMPCNHT